jgi:[acyl-carrier-protein] S-malonyltransferase
VVGAGTLALTIGWLYGSRLTAKDTIRMKLAILCSGQGGQHAGMFALTGACPAAQTLFAQATTLLGHDPRSWVSTVEAAVLRVNRTAQLLCVLQALCAAAALENALPRQRCVAGYSVGEMAAWSVGGLFAPRDALALTAARAEAMDAARRGVQGMLFIRGLSRAVIDGLLAEQDAAVAIVNPGDAFVVAGTLAALQSIAAAAHREGAMRVIPVGVEVASHSPLMREASAVFRAQLAHISVAAMPARGTRLFSGIDGAVVLNGPAAVDGLASQLSQPVQWAACLDACVEAGTDAFLELGPGRALAEMVANAYPGVAARSVDEFKSLEGVRAWLGRPR